MSLLTTRYYAPFFSGLFCSLGLLAQHTFQFRVLDKNTVQPVQFCYVLVKGKNSSAISNENGWVKIKADAGDTLVIYQIGYLLKKTLLQSNDSLVYLARKNIGLEEVTVTANNKVVFREKDNSVFLDFEFYDDNILSLINKGGRYNSLLLSDKNGNRLAELALKVNGEQLFRDCMDNLHLLTKDSVYQVYYDYQNIKLLPAFDVKNYYSLLKHCECSGGDKYIFKTTRYQELKNFYTYYDFKRGVQKQLVLVADSENIRDFKLEYNLMYFLDLRRRGQGYFYSVTDINKYIEQFREELVLEEDYKRLLRPVQSEMKLLDTSFVLFDYTNKTLNSYSLGGELQNKLPLCELPGMAPRLLIDREAATCVFYKLDNKSGILTLYKYNRQKNQLTHSFVVDDFHYLRNFKIRENNLYFIHRNRSNTDVKTKIVKLRMDWKSL